MDYWSHGRIAGHNPCDMGDYLALVLRFTRHWIHYGFLLHTSVCIVVAAVKGWMGE